MSRIITTADLHGRSLEDLQTLYCELQAELLRAGAGSPERQQALASLEAVSLAIARRRALSGPSL